MRLLVRLSCGACQSSFGTVVEGRPCIGHAHIPVQGIIEQWGASHHQPSLIVLGPAPTQES